MAIDADGTFIPVLCYDPDEYTADSELSLADKMFADLGYKLISSAGAPYVQYLREVPQGGETHERLIVIENGRISASWDGGEDYDAIEVAEILACAQKIKEWRPPDD